MAKFHGKKANVFWNDGSVAMSAQSWSVDASVDIAEATNMGDAWKTYIASPNNWVATVEGVHYGSAASKIGLTSAAGTIGYPVDLEGASDNKAKLDLYMVYDTDDYNALYGDAICIGINPAVDMNDVGKVSYSFQGVGSLSVHSATSVHTY